jgi:hypothetical protein
MADGELDDVAVLEVCHALVPVVTSPNTTFRKLHNCRVDRRLDYV